MWPSSRKDSRGSASGGFTLIELLIVTAIISVISLAIFSSFSSGLKIWKKVSSPVEDEETALFLERIGAELRGALLLRDPGFQGTEKRIEFPLVAYSRRMEMRTVGKAVYAFNADAGTVERSFSDYSAIFTGAQPTANAALRKVRKARFSFYGYDPAMKRYEWKDSWPGNGLPLAVKIELERQDKGAEGEALVRTFPLPAAKEGNG